jgi:hypothetical protein
MEIAGFDSVVITSASSHGVVRKFINRLRERWPAFLMEVEGLNAKVERQGGATNLACLSVMDGERHSIIYFYRDDQMRRHFKDHSWVLDSSNEGSFSLHFRMRRQVVFELASVKELTTGEKSVGHVDPYPGILCSPTILEITLVSPGDAAEEPFSHQILSMALSSVLES